MSEAAVKIAKACLKKSDNIYKSLLSYHSTKLKCGFSPAELLFGRKLRTTVPIIEESLQPQLIPRTKIAQRDEILKSTRKRDFDRRHKARELSTLDKGQNVWITDKREYGRVLEKAETPRSYIIETNNGTVRRNRFHLIPAFNVNADESFEPDPIPDYPLPNADRNNDLQITQQTSLSDPPCGATSLDTPDV